MRYDERLICQNVVYAQKINQEASGHATQPYEINRGGPWTAAWSKTKLRFQDIFRHFSGLSLSANRKNPAGSLLGVRLDDYDAHTNFNTSRQKDSSEEVQKAPSLRPEVGDEATELQDT